VTIELGRLAASQVAAFVLVLGRIGPLFVLVPAFSSHMVPLRARVVVAVALAIGLTPLALGGRPLDLDTVGLAELMLKEILVGFAFALAIGLVAAALSTAGSLLDTQIGFGFGAVADPVTGVPGSVLLQLYTLFGVAIFLAIGGDAWVIEGIARTYELVPLDGLPPLERMSTGILAAFGSMMAAALEVCAPVLLALIVTDAAFGLVSRVVPQMNVFGVGFPAKIVVGLLVVAASLPFVANWFGGALEDSVGTALRGLGAG
jgi:flagellar biosynthetic protein FliR